MPAKVAILEPRLCHCSWEEQPIVVEDGEVVESSPSLYQTPLVVSLDENQELLKPAKGWVRQDVTCPIRDGITYTSIWVE